MTRRPVPVNVGAAARLAGCAAALVLLAGCSPPAVVIESPELDDWERRACAKLVRVLPQELSDQPLRGPTLTYGAAWGDPAIVLRCGVGRPAGFTRTSACQIVNDVAWFIPEDLITGEAADIVMTTVGRSPAVEVSLPAAYFPPATAMAQLAGPLERATTEVEPCG